MIVESTPRRIYFQCVCMISQEQGYWLSCKNKLCSKFLAAKTNLSVSHRLGEL